MSKELPKAYEPQEVEGRVYESAGDPESGIALHPLEADQNILEGAVHGVTHVELAGDIGGRHDDGEGLLPFYLALGFEPQGEEQEQNGIRYTPMKYVINRDKILILHNITPKCLRSLSWVLWSFKLEKDFQGKGHSSLHFIGLQAANFIFHGRGAVRCMVPLMERNSYP